MTSSPSDESDTAGAQETASQADDPQGSGATEQGGTGNLSETGLFVITSSPVESGKRISLALRLADDRVLNLSGAVVWMSKDHHVGRSPGMGVRLDQPPNDYLDYVKRLP